MCEEYQRLQHAARDVEREIAPSTKRSRKGLAKARTRTVSGVDAAGHFERPDAAGSPSNGKGITLLGSYEEAAGMLSDEGITVSVNKLREVSGHIGRRLGQITLTFV